MKESISDKIWVFFCMNLTLFLKEGTYHNGSQWQLHSGIFFVV
jgi:hypothetical protein